MRSFTRRGKDILIFATLFVMLLGTAVSAQDMEKPGIAVYVAGDIPNNEKKVLGAYLLASIVKNGNGVSAENADAFLAAAMGDEQTIRDGAVNKGRICELGRQFNIRYVCVTSVVSAFGFFVVSTNMIDTETEEVIYKGEAQSPLKTMEDLTQVCNTLVESMFGGETSDVQTRSKPESSQSVEPVAEASTAAMSVTGEAKVVVDRVVAAVNAFKDATSKSIDAANAVKTAVQSKNFSAIKEAKKKVESATEAVKKAKADVTAAIEALNSAGPEATAAVKAMGIDLSMFAGKEDDGAKDGKDATPTRKTKNGFTLGYIYSDNANIFQAGFAQARPITETGLSFIWETNIWSGWGGRYHVFPLYTVDNRYALVGVNIPLLFQFDLSVFSLETGVQADILNVFGSDVTAVFNAGFVVGSGLSFKFARCFYRFNYGTGYYSQMFGIRMMF